MSHPMTARPAPSWSITGGVVKVMVGSLCVSTEGPSVSISLSPCVKPNQRLELKMALAKIQKGKERKEKYQKTLKEKNLTEFHFVLSLYTFLPLLLTLVAPNLNRMIYLNTLVTAFVRACMSWWKWLCLWFSVSQSRCERRVSRQAKLK